jgi:hypothetical protein
MDRQHDERLARIGQLRQELETLEQAIRSQDETAWQATSYYATYHASAGFLLGSIAATASLLYNIIGSSLVGLPPLRIIQVYLTFPLGEKALSSDFNTGIVLAIGCCLYIGTGMLLGIPIQMAIARFTPKATWSTRVIFASFLGLAIWAVNFYLILAWLQPLLFRGNWIVDPAILPWWVSATTHLVFAWTMALIYPWGQYTPYQRPTEQGSSAIT